MAYFSNTEPTEAERAQLIRDAEARAIRRHLETLAEHGFAFEIESSDMSEAEKESAYEVNAQLWERFPLSEFVDAAYVEADL